MQRRLDMEWISVKDRLPEFEIDVVVYIAGAKNIYKQSSIDHSRFSNYEPKVTVMRLYKSKSSKEDNKKGIYWNHENGGNKINFRDDMLELNLITHWMPLPDAPTTV